MPKPIRTRKRTWDIPGAWYFVTCVTRHRSPIFADPRNMALLRETLHRVQELYPFKMRGYAFMPDHFHILIALGPETHIPKMMHSLQRNYTVNYKKLHSIKARIRLWQRSYWEHLIKDQEDMLDCLYYVHNNPLKHGLERRLGEYPYTSFGAHDRLTDGRDYGAQPEQTARWAAYEPQAENERPMGE